MKNLSRLLVTGLTALLFYSVPALADTPVNSAATQHEAHKQDGSEMGLFNRKPDTGAEQAGGKLARIDAPETGSVHRKITMEIALKFREALLADMSHSVESACATIGVRAGAVRQAIHRFHKDKCATPEDEAICMVLANAKTEHIQHLRKAGMVAAGRDRNGPGANWFKWQLEVQDPINHPRKLDLSAEVSGKNGRPIALGVTELPTEDLLKIVRGEELDDIDGDTGDEV